MAITQVGSSTTASNGTGAALAVPTPTNAGPDSLMLVWYVDSSSAAPSLPTGWTNHVFNYDGSQGITLAWGHPTATTETFTPNSATFAQAIAVAYLGVSSLVFDPQTPANAYSATGAATTFVNIAGLENSSSETTQVPGDLLVMMFQTLGGGVSSVSAWPSGFTGVQTTDSQGTSFLGLCTKVQSSAGTAGSAFVSFIYSSGFSYVAQLIALQTAVDTPSISSSQAISVTPMVIATAPTQIASAFTQVLPVLASPEIPATAPTQIARSFTNSPIVSPGPLIQVASSHSQALIVMPPAVGNAPTYTAFAFSQGLLVSPTSVAEFAFRALNYSNAADGFLTSNVTQTDTFFPVSISGWPSAPFEIAVDRGTPIQEICLVTSSTSSTLTVIRNYDQQGEYPHSVDAIVEIVASAVDWADFNLHNTDSTRDDHPSLMLASGARHDLAARHTAGQVIPSGPPSASNLGDLPQAGTYPGVAMGDHQHLRTDSYGSYSSSLLMVGLITPTISGFSDSRFLRCDGGWYNQASYPVLYSLIANTYPPVTTLFSSVANPGTGTSPYNPVIHFAVPLVGTYVSNVYTGLLGQSWSIIAV
jgi:hypothetical protein